MGAMAAMFLVGKGLEAWGTSKAAKAADMRRNELQSSFGKWLPDIDKYQRNYFTDMSTYLPQAAKLSRSMGAAEQDAWFANKERALPGFTKGIQGSAQGVFDLMRGQMPADVLSSARRGAGADFFGSGFGGEGGMSALKNFLYQGRGSMGAMQTGFGLLPSLLSALPNLQQTSVASILGQGVMNPLQRTQTQLTVRGQNIDVAKQLAGMPMGRDVWGQYISNMGGQLSGMGMMGMGGNMGGATGWGQVMQPGTNFAMNPSGAAQSANLNGAKSQAAGILY